MKVDLDSYRMGTLSRSCPALSFRDMVIFLKCVRCTIGVRISVQTQDFVVEVGQRAFSI